MDFKVGDKVYIECTLNSPEPDGDGEVYVQYNAPDGAGMYVKPKDLIAPFPPVVLNDVDDVEKFLSS